ncbi:MAG: LysE family translocator [Rubrobacteraceae bacterium]|nr:LysE family translocator [Rubrobacteraceae bacterium]
MLETAQMSWFLVASLALIAIPGQDNIYIITRGIAQGRKAALVSAWGVGLGLLIYTSLTALGLSALLKESNPAFAAVKYVGAAYLTYLGARMILSKGSLTILGEERPEVRLRAIFFQGVASNALNPKVALFFLAFLPQFVSPEENPTWQLAVLGSIFTLLTLVITSLLAYFSGSLGDWLRRKPGSARVLQWLAGSVLIGLGVRLALATQG